MIKEVDDATWQAAGPLSMLRRGKAEDAWVVVKLNGECNVDVEVPPLVARVMADRLEKWLTQDMGEYTAFSLCEFGKGRCAAGLVFGEHTVETDCYFAKKRDEATGLVSSCFTILAGGTSVLEIMDIIRDYIDKLGPPPRHIAAFRNYVRAMLNFYRAASKGDRS